MERLLCFQRTFFRIRESLKLWGLCATEEGRIEGGPSWWNREYYLCTNPFPPPPPHPSCWLVHGWLGLKQNAPDIKTSVTVGRSKDYDEIIPF